MRLKNAIWMTAGLLVLAGCSGGDSGGATGTTGGSNPTASTTASSGTTGGGASDKKLTIAVIPKGSTHEYWKAVHAGAQDAADELKNIDIKWKGPINEGDKDSQIQVVDGFVADKVDGIVLAPLDNKALAKPVKDANGANIPVIVIDSGLDGATMLSYVATDNYKGGQMAAQELAKEIGDKGRVAMLRYAQGSASTEQREKGFLDEMAKHTNIKVVSSDQYAGTTIDTAQTASENLFNRPELKKGDNSPNIDGFYAPNESSTFGTLRTLENMKWAGKLKFVGFDSSDKLIEGLKKGEINGLIIQNPYKMGYLGVKSIAEFVRGGKKPDEKVDTGATLVTKENLAQPDIDKLVNPKRI